MAQLHVEADGVAQAAPEVVWELVANANSYSRWDRGARAVMRISALRRQTAQE
jgi:hypothetical protein